MAQDAQTGPAARIRLLGGVGATTAAGEPLDIGPAKCQLLLAVLALSAGSAVPVTRLVELMWDDEPPRTAEKTLQSYVVHLRRSLGADLIVRSGAAYRFEMPTDAVDVGRFRAHLDAGDIGAALAEWTGRPFAGLDPHGLRPVVDGLIEQWLGAVELDLERRVESDAATAIGPLTEITADHPFREGLWALLMTALYSVGRQADALAAYQQARGHLVRELGVEPGPRLRALETRILAHDQQLQRVAPGSERPSGTVTFGFCEVTGSSQLWAVDRRKMAAAMARLDELVRATVGRQGGFVFAVGGESFGAAFHRADDAAAWATELQLETSLEPWPGGAEVRLRIGLHTGETEERGNSYFGPAVTMAAQIAAAGHGGQILVSDVAAALLERTDLVELGRYRLDTDVAAHPLMQLGPGAHPPLRADSRRGNLPLEPGRLIGRAQDLNRIATALQASPVVTLVGPGGIGKTRLALAAARMSDAADANRAWFVELAAISASADVPRTVAGVLDVKEPPGRTLTDAIVANLRLRPALLVLDNCEHVIEGAAILAHAIVEQCPQVSVLATSREGLRIPHEQLIAVAPLDPAGSGAELFDERASALSPTFDAGAHRADVEEICRRLDGIPLAIELAAARTPSLTPRDLLVRLSDRLRLLTRGHRTSAARHQTLRAAVQWSLDLLTPAQQLLFQQLSLFAGTFDAPAAAAVANTSPADAEDLLGDLVERSMLVVESGPFGQRFRYLETIREYAAGELRDRGDTDLIAGRHARWCLDQVTQIHQLLVGPGEVEGVARLAELWPNLRAAVDRACADRDGDLLDALVRPVVGEVNLRNQTEIGDWAERILSITPAADEDRTVFWLACATYRFKQSADHDGYERLVRGVGDPAHPLVRFTRAFLYDNGADLKRYSPAAVAWLRRRGEDHPAALAEIGGVAYPLMSTGQFAELDSFAAVLADRYRSQGPPTLLYVTLTMLGYSAFFQGDPERAERLFDEAARVDVPDGTVSVNKPIEARAAFRRGNQMRAFEILRAYIDELLAIDYPELAPNAAIEFINMMAAIDRPAAAAPVLSYLTASGDFGVLALRTVVADAAAQIAGAVEHPPVHQPAPDAGWILRYMRDTLGDITAGQQGG